MKTNLLLFCFLLYTGILGAQTAILPQPQKIEIHDKKPLVLDENSVLVTDKDFRAEVEILKDLIKDFTGFDLEIMESSPGSSKAIVFRKIPSISSPEGYSLETSNKGAIIQASGKGGAYYGGISFLQLLENKEGLFQAPSVSVQDHPRFEWRGIMLDASRTFLSVDYLKKNIDRMSFYKLNTLHLHLTDDQGWRLEIKERPLLTEKGATFVESANEPPGFEGFYTQEEMSELITYAATRNVQLVPEIEVPGHSSAAIHAYPELSCSGRKVPIYPLFEWGPEKHNDVYCAGNESTYEFLEDVLKEVTSLYPSPYVHLGGDEVNKQHWKNCLKCQAKMNAEGIDTEEGLQRYVMERVGKLVQKAGKRPIGWDEIMEGEIDTDWIVMAWRDQKKGREALSKGYQVVMTPTSHMYFDYSYEQIPGKLVYAYDPVPEGATEVEKSRILGIQANFWSHIDRWESRIDYQLYPRTLALAERAWSDERVTDYEDFRKRREIHNTWLHFFEIEYNYNDH